MRRASLYVAVLLSFGKLQLARHPLFVKLEPRATTLEPILCSGEMHQANGKSSFTQSSAFRHSSTTTRIWSFCGGDRFTGDRRRQNEKERLIHPACLPYAPRLKRILLKNGATLFGSIFVMFATV